MDFLTRISQGTKQALAPTGRSYWELSHPVASFAVNKGLRYGSAGVFGFVKGYYRERALIRGVPVDALAGGGLTIASALLQLYSNGRSPLASHLGAVGDSGMTSWINSVFAAWGAKKSGRMVYVLDAGAKAPPLPAGMRQPPTSVTGDEAVGEIPAAAVGTAFLSAEDIAQYRAPRK